MLWMYPGSLVMITEYPVRGTYNLVRLIVISSSPKAVDGRDKAKEVTRRSLACWIIYAPPLSI